jgi:hypothetical protein
VHQLVEETLIIIKVRGMYVKIYQNDNHVGYLAASSATTYQRSGWLVHSFMSEVICSAECVFPFVALL